MPDKPQHRDPVRAARGMLQGKGISVADLLDERRCDRELEAQREATLERILDGDCGGAALKDGANRV